MEKTLQRLLIDLKTQDLVEKYKETFPRNVQVLTDLPDIIEFLRNVKFEKPENSLHAIGMVNSVVTGLEEGDEPCALGFMAWKSWIGLPIRTELTDNMLIVIYCLNEMTHYGPDDDFQKSMGRRGGQKGRNMLRVPDEFDLSNQEHLRKLFNLSEDVDLSEFLKMHLKPNGD